MNQPVKVKKVNGTWYVSTLDDVPMFAGTFTEVLRQVEQYLAE